MSGHFENKPRSFKVWPNSTSIICSLDQKQSDDLTSLLPESISHALKAKDATPPFRSERVLCVHPTQGLTLQRALTGQLEFALAYEQVMRFGVLEGAEGIFILAQREPDPRLFWSDVKSAKWVLIYSVIFFFSRQETCSVSPFFHLSPLIFFMNVCQVPRSCGSQREHINPRTVAWGQSAIVIHDFFFNVFPIG